MSGLKTKGTREASPTTICACPSTTSTCDPPSPLVPCKAATRAYPTHVSCMTPCMRHAWPAAELQGAGATILVRPCTQAFSRLAVRASHVAVLVLRPSGSVGWKIAADAAFLGACMGRPDPCTPAVPFCCPGCCKRAAVLHRFLVGVVKDMRKRAAGTVTVNNAQGLRPLHRAVSKLSTVLNQMQRRETQASSAVTNGAPMLVERWTCVW